MKDQNSYLYRRGTNPNTRVAVSQKNKVFTVPYSQQSFSQIGVMSSFSVSESRSVEPVRGIGYGDQIAELVPGVTDAISLEIERQLLYLSNMHQVLGYKGGVDGLVRSLKHHQWPFDVKHEMVFSRIATEEKLGNKQVSTATDGVNDALLTFYEACWLNDYSYDFASDSAQVSESVSATCSDVVDGSSTYGELASNDNSTGNNPFASGENGSRRFDGNPGTPTF
jgi:hypothetical protein